MSYSIVIPSKSPASLMKCVQAIRTNKVRARIIVCWDNADKVNLDALVKHYDAAVEFHILNHPFVFARNVNIGIDAAGGDDVVVLNDDAMLSTASGFDLLAYSASSEAGKRMGAVSALMLGMAAAPDQVANMQRINEGKKNTGRALVECKHHMLAFMAVYLRREVIEEHGLLDERFVGYGFDDDDYCLRVRKAGLGLGVEYSCLVEHGSVKSTFRGNNRAGVDMLAQNRQIFHEKWGENPWAI